MNDLVGKAFPLTVNSGSSEEDRCYCTNELLGEFCDLGFGAQNLFSRGRKAAHCEEAQTRQPKQ